MGMEYIVAVVFIVLSAILYYSSKKRLLPPGPMAMPFIGHMHLLTEVPHEDFLKLAKKFGSIMMLRLGSIPVVIISDADTAKEFLKTHDAIFASRPHKMITEHIGYHGKIVALAPYNEHVKITRKLCTTELLSNKRVASYAYVRAEECARLIKRIASATQNGTKLVKVKDYLAEFTYNSMSRMLMNKIYFGPDAQPDEALLFREVQDEMFLVGGRFMFGDHFPYLKWLDFQNIRSLDRLHKLQDNFLKKIVDDHRRDKEDTTRVPDFVDILLSHYEERDDDSIKALIQELLAGGTATSINTVEWALAELVKNKGVLEKAQEELDRVIGRGKQVEESVLPNLPYLEAIVKETLRLHLPSTLLLPREAMEECKVRGYVIPKGTQVLINAYAIGKDPAVWEEGEVFNPDRFLGKQIDIRGSDLNVIPFGSGRRVCPGSNLGLLTVSLALSNILNSFEFLHSSQPKVSLKSQFGIVTHLAQPIHLALSPYTPLL